MSMEAALKSNMLRAAELYSKATGRSLSTVSSYILNDGAFFRRVGEGAGFRVQAYDTVMAWLITNWPDDVDWPEGVPKPPKDPDLLFTHASEPTPGRRKNMSARGRR